MGALYFFWLVLVGIVIIAGAVKALKQPDRGPLPYRRREFLSAGELRFFHALRDANAGRLEIAIKPRLADLIDTTRHDQAAFARIAQKHTDFVLCDRETARPMLVIELDDSSHQRNDRIKRDEFVDAALKSAGLKVLHVRVTRSYESLPQQIRNSLGEADFV